MFGFEKVDDMRDLKLNKMYIDIGASSKEEAAAKVNIGDSCRYPSGSASSKDGGLSARRWIIGSVVQCS